MSVQKPAPGASAPFARSAGAVPKGSKLVLVRVVHSDAEELVAGLGPEAELVPGRRALAHRGARVDPDVLGVGVLELDRVVQRAGAQVEEADVVRPVLVGGV